MTRKYNYLNFVRWSAAAEQVLGDEGQDLVFVAGVKIDQATLESACKASLIVIPSKHGHIRVAAHWTGLTEKN